MCPYLKYKDIMELSTKKMVFFLLFLPKDNNISRLMEIMVLSILYFDTHTLENTAML